MRRRSLPTFGKAKSSSTVLGTGGSSHCSRVLAASMLTKLGACGNSARNVRISEAPSFGQPVIFYDPSSKGAEAYRTFANEFSRRTAPAIHAL